MLSCAPLTFPFGGVAGGGGGGSEGGGGQVSSGSTWSSRSEVNLRWLFALLEFGFRVDESYFPPTVQPNSGDVYLGRGVRPLLQESFAQKRGQRSQRSQLPLQG